MADPVATAAHRCQEWAEAAATPRPPRQVECMDDDCDAPGAWHTHPATTPDPVRPKP